MPFDENLASRVRKILARHRGVNERKMFGGLCFTVNGHMLCGVNKENLMIRIGSESYDEALSKPHVRKMDFTGRALKGFIYVDPEGYRSDESLKYWIKAGLQFVSGLPPK